MVKYPHFLYSKHSIKISHTQSISYLRFFSHQNKRQAALKLQTVEPVILSKNLLVLIFDDQYTESAHQELAKSK